MSTSHHNQMKPKKNFLLHFEKLESILVWEDWMQIVKDTFSLQTLVSIKQMKK